MGLQDYLPHGNWGLSPSRLYEPGSPLDVGARRLGSAVSTYGPPIARAGLRGGLGVLSLDALARPGGLRSAAATGASEAGRYLTSAPPLGDVARGMGMIEGPEPPIGDYARGLGMVEGEGTDTTNPAVMGARNSPSPADKVSSENKTWTDPSPGMFPEYTAHAEASRAASERPAMRAIRLPGGKFLFTNRPEYGGEEISVKDAGREVRGYDATPDNVRTAMSPRLDEPGGGRRLTPASRIDPTSATMSALVRSSIRSAAGERAPGNAVAPQPVRGRMTEGITPDVSGGAVSMIEGTPDQQRQIRLEDAIGMAQLAGVEQERKVNEMDPVTAARLGNPQVTAGDWALRAMMPRIDAVNQQADEAVAQAHQQIQDPKQLQQRLIEIENQRARVVAETRSIMEALLGIRPQQIY